MMQKYPFPFSFLFLCHSYSPFTEAIFLPFCYTAHTTEKTKTAIDYLDHWANQQTSKSQKARFHGVEENEILTKAILGFSFIYTFEIFRKTILRWFCWPQGMIWRNPTSPPTPNYLLSSTEARHCTANGTAKNSIHVHSSRRLHIKNT